MKKSTFEQINEPRWQHTELLLAHLDRNSAKSEAARLPALFRQLCGDLSLAQHRMYGRRLCDRLNSLVVRCYSHLNAGSERAMGNLLQFALQTFPRAARKEWKLFLAALGLFWVPFILMVVAAYVAPEWIFSVLEPEELIMLDSMHGADASPADYFQDTFSDGSGFAAFAYYVQHNVGIGLKMFGMGILFCLGSVYELIWEGVKLGGMFGYIHYSGHAQNIWHFAISHSSFELTGLIICGVAGMRLGLGVLFPGQLPRGESISKSGREALPLILGGAGMVFLAAIVEGFWSSSKSISGEMRYTFGTICWLLWAAYFTFCGRERHHA